MSDSSTGTEREQRPISSVAPSRFPWLTLVGPGLVGAWLFVLLDLTWVLGESRARLTSIWELQHGLSALAPAWLLLAALPGVAGAAAAAALSRAKERQVRLGLALGGAAYAGLVAWGVGGGRHLATWSTRGGFALALAVLAALFFWILAPLLARWLSPEGALSRRRVQLLVSLGLSGALFAAILNRLVLVRLYPAFHAGLSFLSCALFGAVAYLCWTALLRPTRAQTWALQAGTAGSLLLAALFFLPGSQKARGFDNFRWLLSEGSPSLAWGVEMAAHFAPPAPIEEELLQVPLGARRASAQELDLRGRSVLLVTVDALRADHVGVYGAERDTTPHLDRLAESGVIFDAAYAPTPHTSYSLTSLLTGKYMRPLLLQGAGEDSDLWPEVLQTYGYHTAGFYPPAVFFIDAPRFASFRDRNFGFEYAKVEFAEGEKRVAQVQEYLESQPAERPLFVWLHLFGPHEPYEQQEKYFGPRDIDRYDSEIHAADQTLGRVVELFRARDPRSVVLVSADHGEEFGDHGGRYHGTSVYDEQVRVPLIISVPDLPAARREAVPVPVQTIDLFPTILSGLKIPVPPRIRGRDLSPFLLGKEEPGERGLALSETDQFSLLATDKWRLICARRSGACQLFDIEADPAQLQDVAREHPQVLEELKSQARAWAASHGRFESQGLRAEGKGWPSALLRGISGDHEVTPELAALLDDVDVEIRRKSAELLFILRDPAQAQALRLAYSREEDAEARRWLALALTRLGHGVPSVHDLLRGDSLQHQRYAALVLAEQGERSGEEILLRWWQAEPQMEHEKKLEILSALSRIHSKKSVPYLIASLADVRLRPAVAETLAQIGDKDARPYLTQALQEERFVSARLPLAQALHQLGAKQELVAPLLHFLGVPDPLEGGLALAQEAGILDKIGGPSPERLRQVRQLADSGVPVELTIPFVARPSGGVRLLLLLRSKQGEAGQVWVQRAAPRIRSNSDTVTHRNLPILSDGDDVLRWELPPREESVQVALEIPEGWKFRPGHRVALDLFVDRHTEILALALVPRREELPPPEPEPWEEEEANEPEVAPK